MTASAFDTLTAARDLERAEFSRVQAEAIAKAIRNGQGDLATKADLEAAIAGLETRIVERENRLVKWAVALAVVVILGILIRWP